jgi:hypothetical protein
LYNQDRDQTVENLVRVCQVLGISATELLAEEEVELPPVAKLDKVWDEWKARLYEAVRKD